LDPVEPGCLRLCEVEPNVMSRGPGTDLGLEMRTIVVQHDVQDLLTRVTSADPLEERQELHPSLVARELAVESVGLKIVDRQEMTHTTPTLVGGPQTIDTFAGSRVAMPMTRLQAQRAKLADAQESAAAGPSALPDAD